ncbi:MAG TPA: hypothetical protein VI072_04900 [Polyangiaceae bacterium]
MNAPFSLALVALLALSLPARAENAPERQIELDVGAYVHPGTQSVCQRSLSDLVTCSTEFAVGPLVGGRWRFSEHAAAGAFGSLGWSQTTEGSATHLRLAAQFRWHPFGSEVAGLWLGPDAGVLHVSDTVNAGELGPETSYSTTAPALGLGTGLGIPLVDWLELGLMLRGYLDLFGNVDDRFSRQPQREAQAGVGVALTFTFLP